MNYGSMVVWWEQSDQAIRFFFSDNSFPITDLKFRFEKSVTVQKSCDPLRGEGGHQKIKTDHRVGEGGFLKRSHRITRRRGGMIDYECFYERN